MFFIFIVLSNFCRSLFVRLYFFFWSLCCLFFALRILITPLVSSNSSNENLPPLGKEMKTPFRAAELFTAFKKFKQ